MKQRHISGNRFRESKDGGEGGTHTRTRMMYIEESHKTDYTVPAASRERHASPGGIDDVLHQPRAIHLVARDRQLHTTRIAVARPVAAGHHHRAIPPGRGGVHSADVRRHRRQPNLDPRRRGDRARRPEHEPRRSAVGPYQPPGAELDPSEVPHDHAKHVRQSLALDRTEYRRAGGPRRLAVVGGPLRRSDPGGRDISEADVSTLGVVMPDAFEDDPCLVPRRASGGVPDEAGFLDDLLGRV